MEANEKIKAYYRQCEAEGMQFVPRWLPLAYAFLRQAAGSRNFSIPLVAARTAEDHARRLSEKPDADEIDAGLAAELTDLAFWIRKHPEEWKKGAEKGFYTRLPAGYVPGAHDDD